MFPAPAILKSLARVALAGLCLCLASCASLPDTKALIARHSGQEARFATAFGPMSERRSAALVELLKNASGDIDILDKQVALEQAISASPLLLGNKVTLLQDGPATYAAMFDAIRSARDHINFEFYIIEDGDIGQQFADLLIERQASGVDVNLIYDSFGSLHTPDTYFDRMQQAGVRVLEFNPVNPFVARTLWSPNHRDHRKLLIVDGRIAFVGGINISSVYSSSGSFGSGGGDGGPWRDTDVELEGPVVGELQKLFIDTWQKQEGAALPQRDYFPTLDQQGGQIVRAIGSTPDDEYSQMYLTLVSALGNAERSIYLTNAYFVPDEQFLQALLDAAARGVDVRLVLPSYSDSGLVFHAARSNYARLLAGGVHIYEHMDALLHSKTAVIDGVWSTVGSTNLDWRSFADNDEVNVVVLGREFGEQMLLAFRRDLDASKAITAEEWERRSFVLRIKERLARIWQRLL